MLGIKVTATLCIVFNCFIASVKAQEMEVYFGLLHSHTKFSDGLGTPNEAFTMAKEAGLDFMAVTEHNHDPGLPHFFVASRIYHQSRTFTKIS